MQCTPSKKSYNFISRFDFTNFEIVAPVQCTRTSQAQLAKVQVEKRKRTSRYSFRLDMVHARDLRFTSTCYGEILVYMNCVCQMTNTVKPL